jgi:hypothetical protein
VSDGDETAEEAGGTDGERTDGKTGVADGEGADGEAPGVALDDTTAARDGDAAGR